MCKLAEFVKIHQFYSTQGRVIEELKEALLRQQPDATLAEEVKHLRAETKRKTDIIHGLTAEKNMYTSEMATMRVTQEVIIFFILF